jgi:hypothetical protein
VLAREDSVLAAIAADLLSGEPDPTIGGSQHELRRRGRRIRTTRRDRNRQHGKRAKISAGSPTSPRWSPDGRELYYFDAMGSVVRVGVTTDATFRSGNAVRFADASGAHRWDVARNAQKLLKSSGIAERSEWSTAVTSFPITVIVNWTALQIALIGNVPSCPTRCRPAGRRAEPHLDRPHSCSCSM